MTATYDGYRRALMQLKQLPARSSADLEHAESTRSSATALAERAVEAADALTAGALKTIEMQLQSARSALEPLSKTNLVPPRMRPSGGPASATRDDIGRAQRELADAVVRLRQIVHAEVQRAEHERLRLEQQAAEREARAREEAARAAEALRRKRHLQIAAASGAAILILLIIIIAIVI